MSKRNILIPIFIMVTTVILFSENIYINNEIGLKFKMPEGCVLKNPSERKETNKYNISVFPDYKAFGYIKGTKEFEKIENDFKNKKIKSTPGECYRNIEYINIRDINCSIDFSAGCDYTYGMIGKQLLFIKNNNLISINLVYKYKPNDDDETNINSIFYKVVQFDNEFDFPNVDKQIKDYLKKGTKIKADVPKELIELYRLFDELVSSIEFFDSKPVTYKPSIDNLRFRETPDLKGKFIRSLIKNENLELIETGKSDTIDGVKGNWVKVKTEKGEIGWCFDAYLEEVKDVNEVKKKLNKPWYKSVIDFFGSCK